MLTHISTRRNKKAHVCRERDWQVFFFSFFLFFFFFFFSLVANTQLNHYHSLSLHMCAGTRKHPCAEREIDRLSFFLFFFFPFFLWWRIQNSFTNNPSLCTCAQARESTLVHMYVPRANQRHSTLGWRRAAGCIYIYIHISHVFVYMFAYAYVYIYTYICVHMYVYIYICIYIYI